MVKVNFKKLDKNAHAPTYGSEFAAGADLYALTNGETVRFSPGETKMIHTGLAVEIPVGYAGLIYARSGIATKRGLAPANKVGVIDSDYRGEWNVPVINWGNESYTINNGDRIAQVVFSQYIREEFEPAESIDETKRGDGGFGHTGI